MKSFRNAGISRKLGLLLFILAGLTLVNFVGVLYFLSVQQRDGTVIDVSGRNRMLSQRIAYFCERAIKGQDMDKELHEAVQLLDASLAALKNGGIAPGIPGRKKMPATTDYIMPDFVQAEAKWKAYKHHVEIIIEASRTMVLAKQRYTASRSGGPMRLDKNEKAAYKQMKTSLAYIEGEAATMLFQFNKLTKLYVARLEEKQASLVMWLTVSLLVSLSLVGVLFFVIHRYVVKPVYQLQDAAEALSQGDVHVTADYTSEDEMGEAIGNLRKLTTNLEQAANFAGKIGQGDFDTPFTPASEKDTLGHALVDMCAKLEQVNEDDRRRTWSAEGFAMFSELIRDYEHDSKELSEQIISNLVRYLNANQGGLFIVNDDDPKEPFLELQAMYAWDKQRSLQHQHIRPGEGVVGQAWLERDLRYMKQVPQDYISITSGLGEATPRSLIVVPLMVRDEVFGAIELASFQVYQDYEQTFLMELAEILASSLASARTKARTAALLQQSQQHTEQLREQDEMMRQNIEEMQAAQEEAHRNEQDYIKRLEALDLQLAQERLTVTTLREQLLDANTRSSMEKILSKKAMDSRTEKTKNK